MSGDTRNTTTTRKRILNHFLPKFDNQSKDAALTKTPHATHPKCLAVSKKHSGHLVMAPPFYSKNGTANLYSRLGEITLRDHFAAVWPGQADAAFDRWWNHAAAHGLSYSFECVTPRIAGDHGATPTAAYMVLTCVAYTGEGGGICTPAEALLLATAWRLPLNEVTYVPWEAAARVEMALHAARWTATDSDADALLEGSGPRVGFLRHGDTQGEVLEGFVLMALDASPDALRPMLEAYEAAVAEYRGTALANARALGALCHARDPALLARLEAASSREPVRSDLSVDQAWEAACDGDGALPRLFRVLREQYAHQVALKPFQFESNLQIQVEVCDDQIFFGWGLHRAFARCESLYRGMVVQFDDFSPPPLVDAFASAFGGGAHDAAITAAIAAARGGGGVRVLAIAKLKCLNYIKRTFGVRNVLPVLLDKGAAEYHKRTENFYSNWGVPREHQQQLAPVFAAWAREVAGMPEISRKELKARSYLHLLEPFLARVASGAGSASDAGASSSRAPAPLRSYALLLINLTGDLLPNDLVAAYTFGLPRIPRGARAAVAGHYDMIRQPPSVSMFRGGAPCVLLAFGPTREADAASGGKLSRMTDVVAALPSRFDGLAGRVLIGPSLDEWRSAASALPARPLAALPPPPPTPSRRVTVVGITCLPPGGGKSSLFDRLSRRGWTVVSSDAERARRGNFDNALRNEMLRSSHVCYDKNLPDEASIVKLCRVAGECARSRNPADVRILLVVPTRLEHDVAWARVEARSRTHIGLNIHEVKGGKPECYKIFRDIFFSKSIKFLPRATDLPGAVATDAFWRSEGELDALTAEVDGLARRSEGAVPVADMLAAAEGGGPGAGPSDRGGGRPNYVSVAIPGTNLHVTLVPPSLRDEDAAAGHTEAERKRALAAMQAVVGKPVRVRLLAHHLLGITAAAAEGGPADRRGADRRLHRRAEKPVRQLAMWEVEVLDLDDDLHYAPQRQIYHVTDTAALVGCAPRESGRMLRQMREGALDESWRVLSSRCESADAPEFRGVVRNS